MYVFAITHKGSKDLMGEVIAETEEGALSKLVYQLGLTIDSIEDIGGFEEWDVVRLG